ncbi:MAG: hypothetical protein KME31_00215 [Tolypothrix carrinoi HA7290-LM1]|jgi:hypothetical protein|nr:hypothetical protein [Tolypothrix carrinoi HA7290-LM1]
MIEVKVYVGKDYDFRFYDGRGDRDDYYCFDALILEPVKISGKDNPIAYPGKKHTFDFDHYNCLNTDSNIKQVVRDVLFPKYLGGSKANCILLIEVKELKGYDLLQAIKSVQYMDDAPITKIEPFVVKKRKDKQYNDSNIQIYSRHSSVSRIGMTDVQKMELAEDIYGIPDPRLLSED